MKRLTIFTALALSALLAGCGGRGPQSPSAVVGTWAADCSQPFVKFAGDKITVFPDHATYDLKSARLAGGQLTVSYATAEGAVSEVYVQEGQTLRLDHGNYGGSDATWHKAPMKKCD